MVPVRPMAGDAIGTFLNYSVILKDGVIYACGNNRKNRLGLGAAPKIFKPEPILFKPKVIKVACGATHLVILDSDFQAYDKFEKVEGKYANIAAGADLSFFINEKCLVSGRWKGSNVNMKQIFKDFSIKDMECGVNYGFALTHENLAIGWGDNRFKQLGHGKFENVAQISACKSQNHQHSGLVTLDGKVIMMGDTYKG